MGAYLSIGGVVLHVTCEGPQPLGLIGDTVGQFMLTETPQREPDVTVAWRDGDPRRVPLGELIYRPGAIWRMYRSADRGGHTAVISYANEGRLTPSASVLEIEPDWSHVRMTESVRSDGWSSALNLGASELIVRTRVLTKDGIVFHSSAVDDSGNGVLMVGHSGAGKSTQSVIWVEHAGATVLSDDRVVVRIENGQAVAYGTPWGGTAGIAVNASVPLRAILILQQAPTNELLRRTPTEAMPELLVRAFLPYWDVELLNRALNVVERITKSVPVYTFRCRADASVIPAVRSIL